MFILFKKWTAIYVLSLILSLVGFVAIMRYGTIPQTIETVSPENKYPVLIIDPGHGGEDGGAVAESGVVESHVNLSIALNASEITKMLGWNIVMTREDDCSIHDSQAETLRQKKVSDLKNRVALCETIENGILISFHQNSFPGSPGVRGAQVFYNAAEESRELAQAVQSALNCSINEGHPKQIKAIGDTSYLMKHVSCPAILIECGFLSNREEVLLLTDESYQKKLAAVIISAVIEHLNTSEKNIVKS